MMNLILVALIFFLAVAGNVVSFGGEAKVGNFRSRRTANEKERKDFKEDDAFWNRFLQAGSMRPTGAPTPGPTAAPTISPTPAPISPPTTPPTVAPTPQPTNAPTPPTPNPTATPTLAPISPTTAPTAAPTPVPTAAPAPPTPSPTAMPTLAPIAPTPLPTITSPTPGPSDAPVSPTPIPTARPTLAPIAPTAAPTTSPTLDPTDAPTPIPTTAPTLAPIEAPTPVMSTECTAGPKEFTLVGHMSNQGGVFDGPGQLRAFDGTIETGNFVETPFAETPDFMRRYPFLPSKLRLQTYDGSISAEYDYFDFRKQVTDQAGNFGTNILYNRTEDDVFAPNVPGSILSRTTQPEDPWIDLESAHCPSGDPCLTTIWGFNDAMARGHEILKNTRGGVNAYILPLSEAEGRIILWGDLTISTDLNPACQSSGNNAAVWNEVARNNGKALFDISRSQFTGSFAGFDFVFYAQYLADLLSNESEIRQSGTLDEPGVLDDVRTLIILAPGGGTYSTVERMLLRDFVLEGGHLVFTADRTAIAADAIAEVNSIMAEIGSTLRFQGDNLGTGLTTGQVTPSSISTTSGEYCVTTGSEITVGPSDEVIAVFDNTGGPVMAAGGLVSPFIDLSPWTSVTYGASANWELDESTNTSVIQRTNADPVLLCSDFDGVGVDIQGSVEVQNSAQNNDDFFGFAFGFTPGDEASVNADYLLVDWRAADQTVGNLNCPSPVTGLEGLALSRVEGIPSTGEFWGHLSDTSCSSGGVNEILRASNLGSTGWISFTPYTFRLVYSENRLQVYVDGVLEIDYVDSLPAGRLCFYGFNSEDVRYSNYFFAS